MIVHWFSRGEKNKQQTLLLKSLIYCTLHNLDSHRRSSMQVQYIGLTSGGTASAANKQEAAQPASRKHVAGALMMPIRRTSGKGPSANRSNEPIMDLHSCLDSGFWNKRFYHNTVFAFVVVVFLHCTDVLKWAGQLFLFVFHLFNSTLQKIYIEIQS